jgi:hypothetical protein
MAQTTELPKPKRYWFKVTVEFNCPACKKVSTEIMFLSATKPDPNPIAMAARTQKYSCQLCKVPLADGIEVRLNVLPVTLEQAKAMGFKPAPGVEVD